jgi:LSD1 subclass zinc finger protein
MEPSSEPFSLQTSFPPVIFSYCTKTDGGRGEQRMWQIANFLKKHGIASFNGKQVEAGEDWMQKWLKTFANGRYVGQFNGGKANGHGTCTWANGTVQRGIFENDNFKGPVPYGKVNCGACRAVFEYPMGTAVVACPHCKTHNRVA